MRCFVFVAFLIGMMVLPVQSLAVSQPIDCFDYYRYGTAGVFDNMHAEKVSYAPGDKVIISYDLVSKMEAPIVEGIVRIQIFYNDPQKGEQLVDEFVDVSDLSLKEGDLYEGEFVWIVPKGALSGEYIVKSYLISGDMFNLLGISFLLYGPPGVPGEMISFSVDNKGVSSSIYLDKDNTMLDGEAYVFGQPSPSIDEGKQAEIKTRLINKGQAKKVDVSYEVYEWDDVIGAPVITRRESVNAAAGGAVDLAFSFGPLDAGSYEIRITASVGQEKSIMKMRTSVPGAKGRFIFAGLNSFPLEAGDKNSVFFCMSNSADYTTYFNGKGTVELTDDKGRTLFREDWGPIEITPSPMGRMIEFVPGNGASFVTMKVTMSDEDGKPMDVSSVKYDISKFKNIGAKIDVSVDKPKYSFGDSLQYTVTYSDESGKSLNGEVLVVLFDQAENIVYVDENKQIAGKLEGSIKLMGSSGQYRLGVWEMTHDVSAEEMFTLVGKAAGMTDSGGNTGSSYIYAVALIALLAVGGYFALKKKEGRKK